MASVAKAILGFEAVAANPMSLWLSGFPEEKFTELLDSAFTRQLVVFAAQIDDSLTASEIDDDVFRVLWPMTRLLLNQTLHEEMLGGEILRRLANIFFIAVKLREHLKSILFVDPSSVVDEYGTHVHDTFVAHVEMAARNLELPFATNLSPNDFVRRLTDELNLPPDETRAT